MAAVEPAALAGALGEGLLGAGIEVDGRGRDLLVRYLVLLERWNRRFNLTAVRDPLEMVSRHLLDSLAALAFVEGPRVLDAGTGAGLPGLALAAARPALRLVLLDSNGKKTRFCLHAAADLGLSNVEVVRSRLEGYRPSEPFDTVVSRAAMAPPALAAAARGLLSPGGRLVALIGADTATSLGGPGGGWVTRIHPGAAAGPGATRRILVATPLR